jgi:hypothetical protein
MVDPFLYLHDGELHLIGSHAPVFSSYKLGNDLFLERLVECHCQLVADAISEYRDRELRGPTACIPPLKPVRGMVGEIVSRSQWPHDIFFDEGVS